MRTWLFVGSLAAGVLLFVYEWYSAREQEQQETGHGTGPRTYPAEDFIEINQTNPKQVIGRKPPGADETCSICLEYLVKKDESKKYCIIALPRCGHWFHKKCAIRLLDYHPHCPVCRLPIDISMLRTTPVRLIESDDEERLARGDSEPSPSTSRSTSARHKDD